MHTYVYIYICSAFLSSLSSVALKLGPCTGNNLSWMTYLQICILNYKISI